MMDCKHKWVRSGYGNDLICKKCEYATLQAAMPITVSIAKPITEPLLREKIEIPVFTGDKTVRVSVYKDEFEKQLFRSVGLDHTYNIWKDSMRMGV